MSSGLDPVHHDIPSVGWLISDPMRRGNLGMQGSHMLGPFSVVGMKVREERVKLTSPHLPFPAVPRVRTETLHPPHSVVLTRVQRRPLPLLQANRRGGEGA